MKKDIHPAYNAVTVTCSCGNTFVTGSTIGTETLHLDVCSKCHPFYTGKQKIVDTSGRVDRFKQKYRNVGGKSTADVDATGDAAAAA